MPDVLAISQYIQVITESPDQSSKFRSASGETARAL